MKNEPKIIHSDVRFTVFDVEKSKQNGWCACKYKGFHALTNSKVILTYKPAKSFSLNKNRKFL